MSTTDVFDLIENNSIGTTSNNAIEEGVMEAMLFCSDRWAVNKSAIDSATGYVTINAPSFSTPIKYYHVVKYFKYGTYFELYTRTTMTSMTCNYSWRAESNYSCQRRCGASFSNPSFIRNVNNYTTQNYYNDRMYYNVRALKNYTLSSRITTKKYNSLGVLVDHQTSPWVTISDY